MNSTIQTYRRLFLLPLTSVYAVCAGLAMPALGQDVPANTGQEESVNVSDYDTVDIVVDDADLAQVLQMLSMQSHKNIITSKNVSATVTANLYDVTFHEALQAILAVNGYTYNEQGNFIYVYTKAEWKEIQDANRTMVSRTFELDYLSASDAVEFITPLLSENGKASGKGDVEAGYKPDIDDGGADGYAYSVKVVVNDYPENLEEIAQLLDELDTAPDQVLVEATILQASLNEANAFGIDFTVLGGMDFSDIIAPLNAVNSLIRGSAGDGTGFQPSDNKASAVDTNVGGTAGPGGLKVGIVSNDISVFLRVLDQVTDNVVLARPKVMALNRQRAEVLVGARVGYLSTTATDTTTTQSVEFLDTGVQLVFRPFISKDGSIRMELKPSVSEASLRTVTDSNGALVTIPDELTNEITTNVRVRDGQTLVLGGLFKESTKVTRRQVPFLGDVPILGAAFRGQDDEVSRNEIIFLITPTITHDQHLWESGDAMLAMTELARIGARDGLLPFSREKMTGAYNNHAIAASEAGDVELALYHIRNSLRLNPNQANMIDLRQRLTGNIEQNFEQGQLERVIQAMRDRDGHARVADNTPWMRDPLSSMNRITIQATGVARSEPAEVETQEALPDESVETDSPEVISAVEAESFDLHSQPISDEAVSFGFDDESENISDDSPEILEDEESVSSTNGSAWFYGRFFNNSWFNASLASTNDNACDFSEGTSLGEALEVIALELGCDIVTDATVDTDAMFIGSFEGYAPEETLEAILLATGNDYSENADGLIHVFPSGSEDGILFSRSHQGESGLAEVVSEDPE